VEIRVLGPIGVFENGRQVALGGRRQRSVLAGLVAHAGEGVTTDRLIELVWGEAPPPTARKSLQTYVSRLRHILGEAVIVSRPDGYALRVERGQLDADRFEDLVEQGRTELASDPEGAWGLLGAALALWRGSPLADVDADGQLVGYVERLREARLGALEIRMMAGLALGRHDELTGELRALVEAHPMRERLWQQLMLALYRSGRQAEALGAYQRCRQLLSEELGIEPSPELQRLEQQILRQDPALEPQQPIPVTAASSVPDRNPYKGLRAFSEIDAPDFFGREALVQGLIARIAAGARFIALVGPSGSGKSSVAHAGLIPAARRLAGDGDLLVPTMTPGTHPFTQLEAALARVGRRTPVAISPADRLGLLRAVLAMVPDERTGVLLIIDQFEELLSGALPADMVRTFVGNLVEAVEDPHSQLTVIVTLRSDFFDQAMRQPELTGLLDAGVVNVPPLSPVELQTAVVRPARAVGLEVEPELVTELVAETAHHPGSLPLLQFVLTELTDHASGRLLTLAALHRAGGIRGTFARRSEERYSSLSEGGQAAARRLLLHLVTLNAEGEPIRRVVAIDELQLPGTADHDRREALDTLVHGRLLTLGRETPTGRPTVEVAHEAVFREWPRCSRWIDEARSHIRQAADLERAAAEWAATRSPDYLLTGSRLRLYEDGARRSEIGMSPTAAAFLRAAVERRAEEEQAATARAERERLLERRALSRLRVSVAVLAVLVVVAATLSVFASSRSREAELQRAAAVTATAEMLVRQLTFAAVAEAGRDPELSLLLALHAVRVASGHGDPLPAETVEALHWGLQERRVQYPLSDGEVLLLVGTEGPRGAYVLPADELVRLAQASVTRELTADECRAFLGTRRCPAALPGDLGSEVAVSPTDDATAHAPLEGTRVRVSGVRTGRDADWLRAEFAAFSDRTGVTVTYTEDSNLERSLGTGQLQEEHDVIVVPQPGWVGSEVAADRLMELGMYLPREQLVADYGSYLTSLVTVGPGGAHLGETGSLYAVPADANVKSLVWYVPHRFAAAGYQIPATWQELIDLSDRIVAAGGTPWCFGEDSGSASGWPATDWVEDLLLQEEGPEVYDAWVDREIAFADPRVRGAFERLGELFFTEGYVHGGTNIALATPFWAAGYPLFDDPPGCWMYHQASFIGAFFPPELEADTDVSAFPTPSFTDGHRDLLLTGGEFAMVYTDRPEVRALVQHLASPDFGREMVDWPAFIASNQRFETDLYPEQWRRDAATALAQAQQQDRLRFDGSDLMPSWLGQNELWSAMLDYLRGGPDTLDTILARLDAVEAPESTP
jgi:DNA-binding SARP family transcriptional activator/ABC-type glycerol-3-phosphate transport system substrate-binding protein